MLNRVFSNLGQALIDGALAWMTAIGVLLAWRIGQPEWQSPLRPLAWGSALAAIPTVVVLCNLSRPPQRGLRILAHLLIVGGGMPGVFLLLILSAPDGFAGLSNFGRPILLGLSAGLAGLAMLSWIAPRHSPI